MNRRRIPLTRPLTDRLEVTEVESVLASGILTQGPKVVEFEQAVCGIVGTKHAVATTSATTALHLALAALRIGPGDEVLVPDYTFPATANVVIQLGAKPVLVDVDPRTFTMDAGDLQRKLTPAARAVIPVHAFGLAADMDGIRSVAEASGLLVVEDAACALGAHYRGAPVGAIGAAGCFSFHPRKSITTGEGGMVSTNDDDLAIRLRMLRSHGGSRMGNRFTFDEAGYNYRLSDILAAIGVAQVRKLDDVLRRRASAADMYRQLLEDDSRVSLPFVPSWGLHTYQSFVVLLDSAVDRDTVIADMAEHDIETTIGTYALHREPFFARQFGYVDGDFPYSSDIFRRALTLPLFAGMTDSDVEYVVERLRAILDRAVRTRAIASS